MGLLGRSCGVFCIPSSLPVRRRFCTTLAKKEDFEGKSRSKQKPFLPLRLSISTLARAAIGVFGLGFIDAGGDWSRIGVISTQVEELLKLAAFLVVPLCVFLIVSLSNEPNS
ncbi:uncharacterized protein LOC130714282 isoform X2 [Lotus japonicus]|uniref:uncharacterized protein LOC130714282 isoform X2 n=1 Tax=Lotus japonicus TaxID=34305 RepID=UPI002587AD1C|nr:uncharacterized protein LOC130714282 isoform X2 [Lotus japonicus]